MFLGCRAKSRLPSLFYAGLRGFTKGHGELALVNQLKSASRSIQNLHQASHANDHSKIIAEAHQTLALAQACLSNGKLKGHVEALLEAGVRVLEGDLIIENGSLESSFVEFEESVREGSESTSLSHLRTLLVVCAKTMRQDLVERMMKLIKSNENLKIDLQTLNALITGLGQLKDADGVKAMFNWFRKEVGVNSSTFVALLKAFAHSSHINHAVWAYEEWLRTYGSGKQSATPIIDNVTLLNKKLNLAKAERPSIIKNRLRSSGKDSLSCEPPAMVKAAFIDACIRGGNPEQALAYIKDEDCLNNTVLCNAYLSVLARIGDYKQARQLLAKLAENGTIRIKHMTLNPLVKASIRARELGDGRIWASTLDLLEYISDFCDPYTDKWTVQLLLQHARLEGDTYTVSKFEIVLAGLQTEVVASFKYANKEWSFTNADDSKVSAVADLLTRENLFRTRLRSDAFLKFRTGRSQSLKYHLDRHAEKRALVQLLDFVNGGEEVHIDVSGLPMCSDCCEFFRVCANFYGRVITTQDIHSAHTFTPLNKFSET